jgi:hypothetical protein
MLRSARWPRSVTISPTARVLKLVEGLLHAAEEVLATPSPQPKARARAQPRSQMIITDARGPRSSQPIPSPLKSHRNRLAVATHSPTIGAFVTLEDQVRLYPTSAQTFAERYIIGARTIEERADYWIVR